MKIQILSQTYINIPFIVEEGDEYSRSKFLEYCYNNNIVGIRTQTPFKYDDFGLIEPLRISLYNGISKEQVELILKHFKEYEELILKDIIEIVNDIDLNHEKNIQTLNK